MVVTELARNDVSWCIPSRRLCEFVPDLRVRFRIPPVDRPVIHDYSEDDPNVDLFGNVPHEGERQLSATVDEYKEYYAVTVTYELSRRRATAARSLRDVHNLPGLQKGEPGRVRTLCGVERSDDGLTWSATQEFEAADLFTVAAVADGGDTALTLNLDEVPKRNRTPPPRPRRRRPRRRTEEADE